MHKQEKSDTKAELGISPPVDIKPDTSSSNSHAVLPALAIPVDSRMDSRMQSQQPRMVMPVQMPFSSLQHLLSYSGEVKQEQLNMWHPHHQWPGIPTPATFAVPSALPVASKPRNAVRHACAACHQARRKCVREDGPNLPCKRCQRLDRVCNARQPLPKGRRPIKTRKPVLEHDASPRNMKRTRLSNSNGSLCDQLVVGNYLTNNPSKWINLNRDEKDTQIFKAAQRTAWHKEFSPEFLSNLLSSSPPNDKYSWLRSILTRQFGNSDESLALLDIPNSHSNHVDISSVQAVDKKWRYHEDDKFDDMNLIPRPKKDYSMSRDKNTSPVAQFGFDLHFMKDSAKPIFSGPGNMSKDEATGPCCVFLINSNSAFHHLFGLTREEVVNLLEQDSIPLMRRMIHPSDWERVLSWLPKLCMEQMEGRRNSSAQTFTTICRIRHKCGSTTNTAMTIKIEIPLVSSGLPKSVAMLWMPIPETTSEVLPCSIPESCKCSSDAMSRCYMNEETNSVHSLNDRTRRKSSRVPSLSSTLSLDSNSENSESSSDASTHSLAPDQLPSRRSDEMDLRTSLSVASRHQLGNGPLPHLVHGARETLAVGPPPNLSTSLMMTIGKQSARHRC